MPARFIFPVDALFDSAGAPYPGAKLYFYETDGTTPKDTYPTEADSLAHTNALSNPVVADSAGEFVDIFLDGEYKVKATESDDTQIWFKLLTDASNLAQEWIKTRAATYDSATSFTVTGDRTSDYTSGRGLKLDDATTIYDHVASSSYSAGSGLTTVITQNGGLSAGLSTVSVNIIGTSLSNQYYERTAAEVSAGVTPSNYNYPEGDIRRYGAALDGTTDDTQAIKDAQLAVGRGGQITIPKGTALILGSIPLSCSWLGVGAQGVTIKASGSWVAGTHGTMMVDLYDGGNHVEELSVHGIEFDANSISGLSVFGSTNNGEGVGPCVYNNIGFRNVVAAYAVAANSATAGPGALTGSTWINPRFNNCEGGFWVGNNQDDVLVLNGRVMSPASQSTTFLHLIEGINFIWDGGFMRLKAVSYANSVAGLSTIYCPIKITSRQCCFKSVFFESDGTDDFDGTHIIDWRSSVGNLSLEQIEARIEIPASPTRTYRAMVHAYLSSATNGKSLTIVGASGKGSTNDAFTTADFCEVLANSAASDQFVINAHGVGAWDNITAASAGGRLFFYDANTTGTNTRSVALSGSHNGIQLQGSYDDSRYPDPDITKGDGVGDGFCGLETFRDGGTDSSATSPHQFTFTLPEQGMWLCSVSGRRTSYENIATTIFIVSFYDGTSNDLTGGDEFALWGAGTPTNTFMESSGGTMQTLAFNNVTAAGVVTMDATFSATGDFVWKCECRRLLRF